MNATFISVLLSVPLLSIAPNAERIAFRPAAGTALTKSFAVKQEFTLEDSEIKINGSVQKQPDDVEMSMTMKTNVVLADVFAAVDGERVTRLSRTYETLSGNGNMTTDMGAFGSNSRDLELESELEGQAVVFEWDPTAAAYTPRFEKDGGKKDLLTGLVEDFDLRGFLPPSAVEPGTTWKVDVVALRNVLAPGTGHALRPKRGGSERMSEMVQGNSDFAQLFAGSAAREFDARFEGLREADGRRIGVISLSGKISADYDTTEAARRGAQKPASGDAVPDFQKVGVRVEIELSGELEWDLDGGHARSLKVQGNERLMQSTDLFQEYGGNRLRVEDSSTLAGPFDVTVTFRRNG